MTLVWLPVRFTQAGYTLGADMVGESKDYDVILLNDIHC